VGNRKRSHTHFLLGTGRTQKKKEEEGEKEDEEEEKEDEEEEKEDEEEK
jgi:hypothetical protein